MLISYEIFVEAYNSHPKYLTRMIGEIFSYYIFSHSDGIHHQDTEQEPAENRGSGQVAVAGGSKVYIQRGSIFSCPI